MTGGRHKLVILRSPDLIGTTKESLQLAGNVGCPIIERNCRDSSAPKERGPQNDRGAAGGILSSQHHRKK